MVRCIQRKLNLSRIGISFLYWFTSFWVINELVRVYIWLSVAYINTMNYTEWSVPNGFAYIQLFSLMLCNPYGSIVCFR